MSRRDSRDSDLKRFHSRSDREPSPKRYRRDGKPETERVSNKSPNLNSSIQRDRVRDEDRNHRRRLPDALPVKTPLAPGPKIDEESEKKTDKLEVSHKKTNGLSDPTQVPRTDSYFQHDERGSAGQGGRSFSRRGTDERRSRRNSKDRHDERKISNRRETNDKLQRGEKSQSQKEENDVWRHDGFYQLEANPPPPPPPSRKRPAFSEKTISTYSENTKIPSNHLGRPILGSEKLSERDHNFGHYDRPGRTFFGDRRPPNRGNYRGRERFNGRPGNFREGGDRVDKWKHDLFDEANMAPIVKNEEDQIAKVEALLSL